MKYNITSILINEEAEKEVFRITISMSAPISFVSAKIKALFDAGFKDISISRETYSKYQDPEIDISIYKNRTGIFNKDEFEVAAVIMKDAFRQTVFYRLPSKDVNEVVVNLFEAGAKDVRIREIRDHDKPHFQSSTIANKPSFAR